MTPPAAIARPLALDYVPSFEDLANRLVRSFRPSADPVDAQKLALVEQVLSLASSAEQQLAEQRRRIAELETLSLTDELTGLANRRGFDDFLHRTLAVARRYRETGMLAFVDLDQFKALNDQFGHAAGDAVLRHVARLLASNCRESDLVARLHGDEFAIVMVRAENAGGVDRIQLLKSLVAAQPAHYRHFTMPLTASFGLASYGPGTRAADLMRRADRAMYKAKRTATKVATARLVPIGKSR